MVTWVPTASSHSPFHFLLFHLSVSTLHLPLVLALKSAPPRGAPLIEAPDDLSDCSLGQKTRDQGNRGLPIVPKPSQDYPVRVCRVCTAGGDHCSRQRHGQFVYLL